MVLPNLQLAGHNLDILDLASLTWRQFPRDLKRKKKSLKKKPMKKQKLSHHLHCTEIPFKTGTSCPLPSSWLGIPAGPPCSPPRCRESLAMGFHSYVLTAGECQHRGAQIHSQRSHPCVCVLPKRSPAAPAPQHLFHPSPLPLAQQTSPCRPQSSKLPRCWQMLRRSSQASWAAPGRSGQEDHSLASIREPRSICP